MYVRSHIGPDGHTTRTPQASKAAEPITQLKDSMASLSASARPALHWLEDTVRRRPATAMAVAAGLGAIVAIGLRRLR